METESDFYRKYHQLQLRLTILYGYQRVIYADSSEPNLRLEGRVFVNGALRQTEKMDGISGISDHLKLCLTGVLLKIYARNSGWSNREIEDTFLSGKKYSLAARLYEELTGLTPADLWNDQNPATTLQINTP